MPAIPAVIAAEATASNSVMVLDGMIVARALGPDRPGPYVIVLNLAFGGKDMGGHLDDGDGANEGNSGHGRTRNAALRRLGYGKDEMTTHGFRAAAFLDPFLDP
jgi:hypothetical protein